MQMSISRWFLVQQQQRQGRSQWMVQDYSTNGTFVDDVRIPRREALPLPEGGRLRLSMPPGEVLE